MNSAHQEGKPIGEYVASAPVLIVLGTGAFLILMMGANFLLAAALDLWNALGSLLTWDAEPLAVSMASFTDWQLQAYPVYYTIAGLLAFGATAKLMYEMRQSFKRVGTGTEKGSQRFSTEKELRKQYKAVPEKDALFQGEAGPVISRTKKWNVVKSWQAYKQLEGFQKALKAHTLFTKRSYLLVDTSAVNNLIYGTTRSGKGEMFVFPSIDVYSRAETQSSMVFNDPKGELYRASKETLEKRGYHLEVLNLDNPNESMSYNLLQLVKDAYKEEDYSTAQLLCNTLTFSLYHNPNSKDPTWENLAMSLVNAMILAITDQCVDEGREDQICMYAVANMLSELGSKDIQISKDEVANALDLYFQNLPEDSVAKMQYASSNFSKGNMRSSIFSTAMEKLQIFTFDEVARMTSRNSIDLDKVGYGKKLSGKTNPYTRIIITFPNGQEEKAKSGPSGRWKVYFNQPLAEQETLLVDGKPYTITTIDKETGEVAFKAGQDQEASPQTTLEKVVYFDKPVALFVIIPDYDKSVHVISSIFIRQLYFVLAKNAGQTRGGECHRQVVFELDEFGNMPAIEGMSNIITVCLGRNIRFNLFVQSDSQLTSMYGETEADTIRTNCGNQIYILASDTKTSKNFSDLLGERTQHTKSRSGGPLSLNKSETENTDAKPLLSAGELRELKEGETVVFRNIKRQDNKRKRIRPHPIFNTGSTAMKYRWEYLSDDFDTDVSIMDIDIACQHRDVKPKELVVYFDGFSNPRQSEGEALQQAAGEELVEALLNHDSTEETDEQIEPRGAFEEEGKNENEEQEQTKVAFQIKDLFTEDAWSLLQKNVLPHVRVTEDEVATWTLDEFDQHLNVLGGEDLVDRATFQYFQREIEKARQVENDENKTNQNEEELPI